MNRLFGMMPASEIKKYAIFKDSNGLKIRIDAGPNGWTIIYADMSTEYNDVEAATEDNFMAALNIALEKLGGLEMIDEPEAYAESYSESYSEC